jgi:hypothetical protein
VAGPALGLQHTRASTHQVTNTRAPNRVAFLSSPFPPPRHPAPPKPKQTPPGSRPARPTDTRGPVPPVPTASSSGAGHRVAVGHRHFLTRETRRRGGAESDDIATSGRSPASRDCYKVSSGFDPSPESPLH